MGGCDFLQFYFDLAFFVGDRAVEERKMLL
jgi:hypothetical protein